jgi:hypothetical protein
MIEKLTIKNTLDIINFLLELNDRYEDFYLTIDKERKFLKNNWSLIKKILKYQECYGYFDDGLKGLLIVYRSKGFRPYLKILTVDYTATNSLMKFFVWNRNDIEIFCKLKIDNPIVNAIKKFGFFIKGNRGKEVLLIKKGFKTLNKITPKDDYLEDDEKKLY